MPWKNPFRGALSPSKQKPSHLNRKDDDGCDRSISKTPNLDDHLREYTPPSSSDSNSWKLVITHIRANDIANDLGRIPVGFYVAVTSEGSEQTTRNKPILVGENNMEWDDEISLLTTTSSKIYLRVCASYELSPMLGKGETLRMFVLEVGRLFQDGIVVDSIKFSPPEGEPLSPCSLLSVTIRQICVDSGDGSSNQQNHMSNSAVSFSLAHITDEGHEYLLRYRKHKKPDDLERSITRFDQALRSCPPTHQCRAVALFNLATAQFISCQDGASCDLDVPITLYRDALDIRPIGHPDRPATLLQLARAVYSHFRKCGDQVYAEQARVLVAEAQSICSDASYEYQRADGLLREFHSDDTTNPSPTIDLLITKLKDVALQTLDHHPEKSTILTALSFLLVARFFRNERLGDIEESITTIQRAVEITQESDPEWAIRATSHGVFILKRFRISKNMEDLHQSISVLEKVVEHVSYGHPDRPIGLIALWSALLECFEQLGRAADINKGFSVLEEALELTGNDHPNRSVLLIQSGVAFLQHYEHLKNPTYLDRTISLMEEAARCNPRDEADIRSTSGPSDRSSRVLDRDGVLKILFDAPSTEYARLTSLGQAFYFRFKHTGSREDLDKSVAVKEKVLKLNAETRHFSPLYIADLGCMLALRNINFENATDLHRSTALLTEAVRATPNDHPLRTILMAASGISFAQRSVQFGQITDADRSISMEEEALQYISNRSPDKPLLLRGLASSFLVRFHHLGDPTDLERAVSATEEAISLTPVDCPERRLNLTVLGAIHACRFIESHHLTDLNKSIVILEEVAQLVSDNVHQRIRVLTLLSSMLEVRSIQLGDIEDLNKSIVLRGEAASLSQSGNLSSPWILASLSCPLFARFLQTGNIADLDNAISLLEKSIGLTPDGHGNRPSFLISIGMALWLRFMLLRTLPTLQAAISHFSSAARSRTSGQPLEQFQAFKLWFQCAISLRDRNHSDGNQQLLEAFECAIRLFPQLAWLGLPFKDRYSMLREAADITRPAVSLVISLGGTRKAVEWLEHGRCVVWGQSLQLLTPLDELRHTSPDLADQFEHLSSALRESSVPHNVSLSHLAEEMGEEESLERQARRHRDLVAQKKNLHDLIETLPGFEGCFSQKKYSQLRESARFGPIILLHVRVDCGDALIVVADLDEPIHVPLPGINERHAEYLRITLQQLLLNDGRVFSRDSPQRAARLVGQNGLGFDYILSELWTRVVRPILDALALLNPGNPTRVFWCPTGPLSFLPIHAAGNYNTPNIGNKASDFIVSSYIPTLSLLSTSTERSTASENIRLLAVPQPPSDGQTRLSGALVEVQHIRDTVGRFASSRVQLQESDADAESVLGAMERSNWVHFACHGIQDAGSPTDSGLCLANGRRLRLSDIIRLSRPRGGLAFLSACQTATGAVELSEEAVHLSAGMLFAGYSSVIGTMWSIRDSIAPELAKDVYEQLFREGRPPDSREAARALHNAVERLRQSGAPFIAWVPFIHMGV